MTTTTTTNSSATTPKLTAEQADAIGRQDVSIGLSAGAGCGKTFVLTQRFLSHLEPAAKRRYDLSEIVAITFTDKAAREMRDRIRAACNRRLIEASPDEAAYWQSLLRALDQARISTIHSFCTRLLRNAAVEAGLDPQFTVLNEAVTSSLRKATIRRVFHEGLVSEDAATTTLVSALGLEKCLSYFEQLLMDRSRVALNKSTTPPTAADLAQKWSAHIYHHTLPQQWLLLRTGPLSQRIRQLAALTELQPPIIQTRLANIVEFLERDTLQHWNQELETLHETAKIVGVRNWPDDDFKEELKAAFESLRKSVSALRELITQLEAADNLLELATISVAAGEVFANIGAAYESAKLSLSQLDFDDLPLKATQLLLTNETVRSRLAGSIRLLMVDEFQDTDPVSAMLVRLLCADQLTSGKLFLVGDQKQSIYRFRRADPTVFRQLRQELPLAGRLPLTGNFRSQPDVLHFVNQIFSRCMAPDYEPLRPQVKGLPNQTCVEFLLVAEVPAPEGARSASAEDCRAAEADWIARRIAQMLQDPTCLVRDERVSTSEGHARRATAGDIVILFRALTNVAVYEAALNSWGIDFYLLGGRSFFAQQEVYDVLNLLQWLNDPDDELSLLGVLRSPWCSLPDPWIDSLRQPDSTLWEALQTAVTPEDPDRTSRLREVTGQLRSLQTQKDRIPIAALLRSAIELTGYDAALLTEFLGDRKLANLSKLVAMAEQYDAIDSMTLSDFVERLSTSVVEETKEEAAATLPETGAVVRLMSIHQSKGLEFPIVFVADMNRSHKSGSSGAVLHPELGVLLPVLNRYDQDEINPILIAHKLDEQSEEAGERLRLLYVALTRAADRVIVCASSSNEEFTSPWMQAISTAFHLPTGLPAVDPYFGTGNLPAESIGGAAPSREAIPNILVHRTIPTAEKPSRQPRTRIALESLPDLVEQATAASWPRESRTYAPDLAAQSWVTVSELEAAAEIGEMRDTASAKQEAFADATSVGIATHAVLEQVDFADVHGWRAAAQSCLSTWEESVALPTLELVERLMLDPLRQELAHAKQLYRELDFCWRIPTEWAPGGPCIVSGQIDLLWQDAADRWHIADYKTGSVVATAADFEVIAPYRLQLVIYAAAATAWLDQPVNEVELISLRPKVRRTRCSPADLSGDTARSLIETALARLRTASHTSIEAPEWAGIAPT